MRKPSASKLAAAIRAERKRAPLDLRDWSDRASDKFCELTADIYRAGDEAGDEDTEVERHRGFAIVWNSLGVWRVEVKRGKVTKVA